MTDPDAVVALAPDGSPITERDAEEIAREAERGYDLRTGRRVGRRSLTGQSGQSPRLNVRLSHELHERAAERAAQEGKSLSELVREAVAERVGR